MKGILWYVTRKLEGIFDGILMEFYIKSSEDKNQILKSMYIPRFLSSGLYCSCPVGPKNRPVRTSTYQRNDTVLLHQKMIRMDHEVTTHSNVTTRSLRK